MTAEVRPSSSPWTSTSPWHLIGKAGVALTYEIGWYTCCIEKPCIDTSLLSISQWWFVCPIPRWAIKVMTPCLGPYSARASCSGAGSSSESQARSPRATRVALEFSLRDIHVVGLFIQSQHESRNWNLRARPGLLVERRRSSHCRYSRGKPPPENRKRTPRKDAV